MKFQIYCQVLIFTSVLVPFAITDLVFAYRPSSCTAIDFELFKRIHLTLKAWLQISSYTVISTLILIFLLFAIYQWSRERNELLMAVKVFILILWVFRMTWLGVGAVILLSNVDGEYSQHCQKSIKMYMYINIIGNMVIFLVLACLGLTVNITHERENKL